MSGGNGQWKGDAHRKQRRKNIVLMLVLVGLAVLFYLITIVRMGGNVVKGI